MSVVMEESGERAMSKNGEDELAGEREGHWVWLKAA
jgi:hypothetical protein